MAKRFLYRRTGEWVSFFFFDRREFLIGAAYGGGIFRISFGPITFYFLHHPPSEEEAMQRLLAEIKHTGEPKGKDAPQKNSDD